MQGSQQIHLIVKSLFNKFNSFELHNYNLNCEIDLLSCSKSSIPLHNSSGVIVSLFVPLVLRGEP